MAENYGEPCQIYHVSFSPYFFRSNLSFFFNIDIPMPPENERELIALPPVPDWQDVEPRKASRKLADIRGPELVNNHLLHGQFGIMAVTGVHLKFNHINLIRTVINKHMDKRKMFAVWRIEAPWKPVTRKAQGKRMGGGKASIHHYVTPIRAGSVIVELGGQIELDDCYYFLNSIVKRLPCDSFVVSKEIIENWRKEEIEAEQSNINPINYERVVRMNLAGCHKWISPYDHRWFGKYT